MVMISHRIEHLARELLWTLERLVQLRCFAKQVHPSDSIEQEEIRLSERWRGSGIMSITIVAYTVTAIRQS